MEWGRLLPLVAVAIASMGANYRTTNFVVQAPTAEIAQQVGQYAERYRREKALEWIGKEMPPWGQPCPLKVTVMPSGAGGATTFAFDRGAILSQEMNVQGSLERVLNSVLPHEITHTVFAYHFRCPVPRWADEGGSVLSEDELERRRHEELVRQCLARGQGFRLRVLLEMTQYPDGHEDVMTLYAQGYSLSRFLVESTSRPGFLNFVADGMRGGWDGAVRAHFGMNRIEDLEEAWLQWMRNWNKPEALIVKRGAKPPNAVAASRQSTLGQPVVRGASPDEPAGASDSTSRDGWSPVGGPKKRNPVQLLPPDGGAKTAPLAQQALQKQTP